MIPSSLLPLQPHPEQDTFLEEKEITDGIDWLSFHRVWGQLSDEVIEAIAKSLRLLKVEPNQDIYHEGLEPIGLYLIKWGSVEIYRSSLVGKTHIRYYSAGELFGYIPLALNPTTATYNTNAVAIAKSELWFLSQTDFEQLTDRYPSIEKAFNTFLAQDLEHFANRIATEQIRIQGLQPFIRPIPTDNLIIGKSKVSQKLAAQIEKATLDLKPIQLQSPPGGGKTFLAGYIHHRSGIKDHPWAEIDCALLPRDESGALNTDNLFGRVGQQLGVIELLERGTLLIANYQLLSQKDRDRLLDYLQTNTLTPNPEGPPIQSWVRLILSSPSSLSLGDIPSHSIKLSSLKQRKLDIPSFARYFLDKYCQESQRSPVKLSQADLRRLISYDYPANIAELESILKRAVVMTPPEQDIISEQVLWSVESKKNAFRVDLLNQFPWLRRFLLSDWWPERFWVIVMLLFIPVTLMGYLGPQTRDSSMTLNLFWAWWWPFYLLLFPIIGRLWCAVCPFMVTGEWIRKISLWIWPRKLLPWPTKWMNRWGAWLLWAGFVAIYLWEKLADLPHTPHLSSDLLLIITAGAVICSLIYERRLWCRYLCPIGGMNGMFAKLALTELRSTQQICGSQCSTFSCYKGSDVTPVTFADSLPNEGQATGGCPLYSHPAQLRDNRDCVLCMTCLKACPSRSVQFNLRFVAADLLENHQPFWAEVALLLLLFGGVFMHSGDKVLGFFGLDVALITGQPWFMALPVVLVLLSIPWILTYGVHAIARFFDRDMPPYLVTIYAYLPMTLGANLAHYIPAAMTEAGQLLPVTARTFGFSGASWPVLTWSGDVAAFLQGVTLLAAIAFSIYPLFKITQRPLWSNLPHLFLMAALTFIFFQLLL
ncbi:cyclic nucleotide-binding domain-containing protein [Roseofilum sp. BLCC_M154]|uniref:Cyclic nucleotide-binding domain-containing protein n=1 Tax=Roseofilum acuticapitatum BLCC-M154 TaxID=3022444 RepID=A0ABT7AY81_9CYAN|nr:cyclic nucleotide-binding domain-containing protein [Roseofilum acuticapitatum]MDJ1171871.1 cyclic nucleotide-binding domain-containing protein [Roseofilum acuticapitatum BLCC-M154]